MREPCQQPGRRSLFLLWFRARLWRGFRRRHPTANDPLLCGKRRR